MSPATEPALSDFDQCTAVFFARVPPPVPYDDLLALFRQYGEVKDLNLYRRWATAKTSKGCGIVVFSSCSEAKAAFEALNGMKPFEGYPGCDIPMVVEYVDTNRMTPPGAPKPRTSGHMLPKANYAASNKSSGANSSSGGSISSSNASSQLHAWQEAQRLRAALAQHKQAAATAAGADCSAPASPAGQLASQVQALQAAQLASYMRQQAACMASEAALGDPGTWGNLGHSLVPMVPRAPSGNTAVSPLQHYTAGLCQAAAGQPLSPLSGCSSMDLLCQAAGLSPLLPGYPAGGSEPFLAHSSPLMNNLSTLAASMGTTLGSTAQLPAFTGASLGSSEHPLGPGLHPLVLPDDTWAKETLLSAMLGGAGLSAPSGPFSSADSTGYSLFDTAGFDSSGFLSYPHLQGAATPPGMSGQTCLSPSTLGSAWGNSAPLSAALSAPSAMGSSAGAWNPYCSRHVGDLSGALSGHLHELLRQGSVQGAQQGLGLDSSRPVTLTDCMILPAPTELDMGLCSPDTVGVSDQAPRPALAHLKGWMHG